MTYRGKHRADASESFSVHGRANRGVPEGEQNPGRDAERAREQYDQALADQRAREHQARHSDGQR